MHSFGRLLQTYRKRWRKPDKPTLTQEEVSLHVGYSATAYGQWERGRNLPPERSVVVDLIQFFYSGGGIASLAEADDLLQASSFRACLAAAESPTHAPPATQSGIRVDYPHTCLSVFSNRSFLPIFANRTRNSHSKHMDPESGCFH